MTSPAKINMRLPVSILALLAVASIISVVGFRAYWTFDARNYVVQADKAVVLKDLGTLDLDDAIDGQMVTAGQFVVCFPSDWVVQWKTLGGGAGVLGQHHRTVILAPWNDDDMVERWINKYASQEMSVPESWYREVKEAQQRERSDWKAWWTQIFGPQEPVSQFSLDYRSARMKAIASRVRTNLFNACGLVCVARCGDVWGISIERCDGYHLMVLSYGSDEVRQTVTAHCLETTPQCKSSCELLERVVRAWAGRKSITE